MSSGKARGAGLLLCPEYFDGRRNGIGRVSEAMAGGFDRAGLNPIIWSANEPQREGDLPNRCFGRNYPRMILAALLARCDGVRAIACQHVGLSPVARILAWRLRVPWLCWGYGVEVWCKLRTRTQWGIRGNPLLCSISEHTRSCAENLNPNLGFANARIVPLGWMVPAPPPALPFDYPSRSGVLAVGRLSATDSYKGFDTLISAWKLVSDAVPGSRLTIVGDGDDRPRLEALARENGTEADVKFSGSVETLELQRLFSSHSIFAMPSRGEGFGLVFAEAMAYGLPCISGNRDASREVVADGINGYCVDANSHEAVALALIRLLSNPLLLAEFSSRARQDFEEKFDADAVRSRMDSLVRALLSPR